MYLQRCEYRNVAALVLTSLSTTAKNIPRKIVTEIYKMMCTSRLHADEMCARACKRLRVRTRVNVRKCARVFVSVCVRVLMPFRRKLSNLQFYSAICRLTPDLSFDL